MLSLNIAIYDQDLSYAQALSRYMMTVKSQQFSVNLFSTENQLVDYLQNNSLDILLISDSLYSLIKLKANIEIVILLIEDTINSQLLDFSSINKYQKGEDIVNQLIAYYTCKSKKEIPGSPTSKPYLIGIYSPTGGSGKTTISLGIARSLAAQSYSTLFISLESTPSYTHLLKVNHQRSISDLFYYFSLKAENILMKLEGIQEYDECSNLFFLPPPLHPNDMTSFIEEDWIALIDLLIKKSHYEYIILDFTSEYSLKNCQLMNMCHKKLYLINPTSKSVCQFEYLTGINHPFTLSLQEFLFIVNHQQTKENTEFEYKIKIAFEVPYIELLGESHMKLMSNGQFSDCIKELLEVIFKYDGGDSARDT